MKGLFVMCKELKDVSLIIVGSLVLCFGSIALSYYFGNPRLVEFVNYVFGI